VEKIHAQRATHQKHEIMDSFNKYAAKQIGAKQIRAA